MIFEWSLSSLHSSPVLATLFSTGGQRIDEILPLLSDPLRQVRLGAQRLLRYLAAEKGMAAVHARLQAAPDERLNAPVPAPLFDADYEFLERRLTGGTPSREEYLPPILYALGVDRSERAAALRETVEHADGPFQGFAAALRLGRCGAQDFVLGKGERLEDSVFRNTPFTETCARSAPPSRAQRGRTSGAADRGLAERASGRRGISRGDPADGAGLPPRVRHADLDLVGTCPGRPAATKRHA
jgi:hypothetical protein